MRLLGLFTKTPRAAACAQGAGTPTDDQLKNTGLSSAAHATTENRQ